jgi:hypothetical protein
VLLAKYSHEAVSWGDQNNNPAVDHLVGGRLRLLRHRPHVRRAVRDPGSALLTGRQGGSKDGLADPPETVFKEKHGVWGPMPELTITSPYADSRAAATHLPWAWATLFEIRPYTCARLYFTPPHPPRKGLRLWPRNDRILQRLY